MAVIGFEVSGDDDGTHYYIDDDGVSVPAPACSRCKLVDDPLWINPSYRPRRSLDLSATYDGPQIASQRFVDVASDFDGLRFAELPAAPGFFIVGTTRALEVCRSNVRSTHRCEICHRFTAVAGATRLPSGAEIGVGFWSTDVEKGGSSRAISPHLQSGSLVADPLAGAALRGAKLRGLHLNELRRAGPTDGASAD